jgi:hypothetical protein
MNRPYGSTPVQHAVLIEFQRETDKLATTTGGEPVHHASGSRLGSIHKFEASIAADRMQGTEIHRIHIIAARLNYSAAMLPKFGPWFWTGAPCSPQRTWAENGFFQMLSLHGTRISALNSSLFARKQERSNGLRPVFFGPCTLGRTWGTRPVGGLRSPVSLCSIN